MATTTLGLTQYAGTDTMNFLTQYNADMVKIDDSAKMSKAIGSDYIYSYTTPPSYSGGTVTVYSGTKYIPAYGKDANTDIKQTIYTCSTNKTLALTGTSDSILFIDETQTLSSVLTNNFNIVSFISNLPTTVATTGIYVYYVINENRYYYTSGSTTASWVTKIYCSIASVRVASSTITYFKPNLQLNLAQKIGKDKLLFTMADVNANTDKEFVPSATAIKELKSSIDTTYGVDYIVEKGSNANGNYEKWKSGKLVMWGVSSATIAITTPEGSQFYGNYSKTLPVTSSTTVSATITISCAAGIASISATLDGGFTLKSALNMFLIANKSLSSVPINIHWHAVGTYVAG